MNNVILIADDHPLFREALTYIVRAVLPDCLIKEATNYEETRSLLENTHFKLAFLDLNMPDSNGLTDLALLKKLYPQVPLIVVSGHEEPEIILRCLDLDISGYIIKSSSPSEINSAIQTILAGDIYAPKSIDLGQQGAQRRLKDTTASKISSLTPSQLKVLIEIGKGKLNKQIAFDLDITEATVKAHITIIFKKLEINNRTQAVLFTSEYQAKRQILE